MKSGGRFVRAGLSARFRSLALLGERLRPHAVRCLRRTPILGPILVKKWHVSRFAERMHRPLRLDPPVSFNDHVVHRILFDRDPRLKRVCDKIAVREIIRQRVGEAFVVPLLGVWRDPRDIPWDKLPDRFVLKPNHSSGPVTLINSLDKRDPIVLTARATEWLRQDYFDKSLEWGYRNIPRRITAEPFLVGQDGGEAPEAIILTFGGKVAAIRIFTGPKNSKERCDNWFDRDCNRLDFYSLKYRLGDYVLDQDMADRLIDAAERAAAGFSHLRVDFYLTDDGLRIGELTPYMGAGLTPWSRPGADNLFGQFWNNPELISRISDMNRAIADAD